MKNALAEFVSGYRTGVEIQQEVFPRKRTRLLYSLWLPIQCLLMALVQVVFLPYTYYIILTSKK